jgi:hypothetical protein
MYEARRNEASWRLGTLHIPQKDVGGPLVVQILSAHSFPRPIVTDAFGRRRDRPLRESFGIRTEDGPKRPTDGENQDA